MTHFAIICPAETGHLNTMFPLGRELQRRGHRVTFICVLMQLGYKKPFAEPVGLVGLLIL